MDSLLQDLRYAARGLLRNPGFALVAIFTLALGIGANTTIFSAVRAVLLRPLPFPGPSELVQLYTIYQGRTGTSQSPPNFLDLRRDNASFTDLAAINGGALALTGDGPAEQVTSANVSGGFFNILGVPAAQGRVMTAADDSPGAPPVVVISHALWQRRFGADAGILGRTIQLDGVGYQVVGVMPPGFRYPLGTELWVPLALPADVAGQRGAYYLDVIGRLRAGVSLEHARADVALIAERLAAEYPRTNAGTGGTVRGLHEALVGDVKPAMLVLLGAVGLVLLIACVNVANLLLVRGVGRSRELAVRAALGASGRRLARAVLAESVLLGLVGGAAGLLLAVWGGAALRGLTAADVPLLDQTAVDGPVLAFSLLLSLVTGLLFGLVPAWQVSRVPNLAMRMREESGASIGDRGRHRLRHGLVVAELALATTLLVGAGLLTRSLLALSRVDLGIAAGGALTFAIDPPSAAYGIPELRARYVEELLDRLRAVPGVRHAGATFGMPLTGFGYVISGYELDGRTLPQDEQVRTSVSVRVMTPGLVDALGMRLRSGRQFTTADRNGAPAVMIVNERAARLLWPGVDPLGHRFVIGTRLGQGGDRVGGEVVGVVADVRERGPGRDAAPTIYVAHAQFPVSFLGVAVRGSGDPSALLEPVRRTVAALDASVPVFRVRTLEQLTADAVAQPRLYAGLLALFAATALVLAAIGVYGIMAHGVRSRTREIGVRIALGAGGGTVVRMVVEQGALLALAGVGIGLLGAFAATRVLRRLLFGVGPADAVTYAAVAVALLAAALLACWLPARRAARVDPMVAIRAD